MRCQTIFVERSPCLSSLKFSRLNRDLFQLRHSTTRALSGTKRISCRRLSENSNSARSLRPSREKRSERYGVKGTNEVVAAHSCRGCRNVLRDLQNLEIT